MKSEVFSDDIRRVRAVSVSTAVPEANSAATITTDAPAFSAREVCSPAAPLVSTLRSMTVGAASLSVMVTAVSAVRPNSVPVNFTFSVEASWMTSSVGVMVIDFDPLTAFAATATVKSSMLSKSVPAAAPSPVAAIDTSVSAPSSELAALGKETVRTTGAAPASSFTEDEPAVRRNCASSSRMVRAAGLTVYPLREEVSETVSGPSRTVSEAAVKLKVAEPLVWPAGIVTSTEAGAVKSAFSAVSAAIVTVKVAAVDKAACPSGSAAVTVTVLVSPSST